MRIKETREENRIRYDTILENMIVRDGIEQHRIETIVEEQVSTPKCILKLLGFLSYSYIDVLILMFLY